MKILVTGATGFVGACLTRRLVTLGYDVHIFTRKQSKKWRIEDIQEYLTDHEVDLCDFDVVQRTVKRIKPNIIYHLATYGGFAFQQNIDVIIQSNFIGTVNLLRACEAVGFDCFVNTGSSSEYGLKNGPMSENDIPEPLGDYGVTKVASTLYCQSEAIQKKLPIVTLRLFSPYGNWDDPQRLIPYVIKSLLRGEHPRLATPNSVRDYVFIDDVLDMYQLIVNKSFIPGSIYNVGSGNQHSIGYVVSMIAQVIGSGIEPSWGKIKPQKTEPSVWVADITKAKLLGWEVKSSLKEGIQKTVWWMQENVDLYS